MAAAEEKKPVEEKKVEEKPKVQFKFPPNETQLGIIAGVLTALITIFTGLPAVIKGLGMLLAIVWSADSIRKTSKYGLGTGVPSIGVLAVGYGVVGALMGLSLIHI